LTLFQRIQPLQERYQNLEQGHFDELKALGDALKHSRATSYEARAALQGDEIAVPISFEPR